VSSAGNILAPSASGRRAPNTMPAAPGSMPIAQAGDRHDARMASVAHERPASYAASVARIAIEALLIIEQPDATVFAPGGTAGCILRIRVTGETANFIGHLAASLPGLREGTLVVSA